MKVNEKTSAEMNRALDSFEQGHHEEFQRERKKEFITESGIPTKRVYTPLDLEEKGIDYTGDLGFPGEFPFVRGISSTGYRAKYWEFAKYGGHSTPEECNKLWKAQIEAGLNHLTIAYDLPSQTGYDCDHPMAEGEVGRVGISMSSLADWEIAFDGIDLNKVIIDQVFNAPAAVGLASHLCLAEKRGISYQEISGMTQNDIIKEFIARGNYIFPIEESLRLTGDVICYTAKNVPNYRPITVTTYHYSERGATPVQEAAIGLAAVFTYLQGIVDRGVDIDAVAPKIWWLTACDHNSFFEEIAKNRAMRRIYARTLKERFKAKRAESMMVRIYVSTGGTGLQREQYLNNITRNTLACLSSVLGGCEAIQLAAYDECFGIPTQEASINTLRTQAVIAYETDIPHTADPLAGSYFVESLTSEVEERIVKQMEEIDKRGGIIPCIENGYIVGLLNQSAYKWQRAYEQGEILRVGANCLRSREEQRPMRIYRADPKVEEKRKGTLEALKKKRNNAAVKRALDEVKAMARLEPTLENNLVPPIIEAVKRYTTNGEICDALRTIWGESRLH